MRRNKATPEQIAKAKEKRAKVREIAKRIAGMTPEEQKALVRNWPTTIEGHALSVKNACLLAYQGRATVIGGFRQWKKAGRFVRKGESGMSIWIPLMRKTKDANGDEINEDGERPNFGLATVFDISQTEDANAAIAKSERETGLPSLSAVKIAERARDLATLDKAPLDQPLNDEEQSALDREFARERAGEPEPAALEFELAELPF